MGHKGNKIRSKILVVFFSLSFSIFANNSLEAFTLSLGNGLWSRYDGSAFAMQLEVEHRFWGKNKNAFFDLHFIFPLAFRLSKKRPLLLAGIDAFPKQEQVNSLDEIGDIIYLTHYIKNLSYQYKKFHVGLEPATSHFLHNGLLMRENPLDAKNFSRYTPAFSIHNHNSGLYTSEAGQSGFYVFYGSYFLSPKNPWFFLQNWKMSPLLWTDFTHSHKRFKEFGLGLETSTVALKKEKFSLGIFLAFDYFYQPDNYAYKFLGGLEFHSLKQKFAIGTGVRSQNHSDGPLLSAFNAFRRDEDLAEEKEALPSLILFTHPKENQDNGFRFETEIYFVQPSFSYRLEYFVKKENIVAAVGHGRDEISSFADFKNFRNKPLYFSVSLEADILRLIRLRWHTRYYAWGNPSLSSYVSVSVPLVSRPKLQRKTPAI